MLIISLFVSGAPRRAHSAPVVAVHERLDIEMAPVRRQKNRAIIRGRLLQRSDKVGVEGQDIEVRVNDQSVTVQTDDSGEFKVSWNIGQGRHHLVVHFAGTSHLDAAHLELTDFDMSKNPLSIAVQVPSPIDDRAQNIAIGIKTQSDNSPVAIPLLVFFSHGVSELQQIGAITTDANGAGSFVLADEYVRIAGQKRLVFRHSADDDYDLASTLKHFSVNGISAVSFGVDADTYDYGDILIARGRLTTGVEQAIPNAPIAIVTAQSVLIQETRTDDKGYYQIRLDTTEIGTGGISLQANFTPVVSWRSVARSTPVPITIGPSRKISVAYTVATFALTTFALLTFVAFRTKPWRKWGPKGSREESQEIVALSENTPVTGMQLSRPSLASGILRIAHHDFKGRVCNASNGRAIANARLFLLTATTECQEQVCDETGSFSVTLPDSGKHVFMVRAQGFIREEFSVITPHRGEYHGVRIQLLPVRDKIFSMYKRSVRSLLPKSDLWGIWTPRQILDQVRSLTSLAALSELTDFVEESVFSQRTPDETALKIAKEKIRAFEEHS